MAEPNGRARRDLTGDEHEAQRAAIVGLWRALVSVPQRIVDWLDPYAGHEEAIRRTGFARGGYIPPGRPAPVVIDVAECVVRPVDAGGWVCCRGDTAHLKAAGHGLVERDG